MLTELGNLAINYCWLFFNPRMDQGLFPNKPTDTRFSVILQCILLTNWNRTIVEILHKIAEKKRETNEDEEINRHVTLHVNLKINTYFLI